MLQRTPRTPKSCALRKRMAKLIAKDKQYANVTYNLLWAIRLLLDVKSPQHLLIRSSCKI
jgi:hypothetical protein